ncbi:MAG: alkaline phosphatase family protein [Candidatus Cybelea sp.]
MSYAFPRPQQDGSFALFLAMMILGYDAHKMMLRVYFLCAVSAVLTACSGATNSLGANALPAMRSPARAAAPATGSGSIGNIKHVVIIVQENHSFDNLFAHFPGADGASRGKNAEGQWVRLEKSDLYSSEALDNSHLAFTVDYDGGKMDGFSAVYVSSKPCPTCAYKYVNPNQIQPYWTMAQQYGLADHMFTSETSGSFNGHQDLIRGDTEISSTESLIDFPSHGPWGCDAPPGTTTPVIESDGYYLQDGPAPCLSYETLRDLLDAKQVSWKYYTPNLLKSLAGSYWDAFDAISAVRNGPEWKKNISSPQTKIFKDITAGSLADVSWVIPDGVDSDHSGFGSTDKGPSWVASVVNAIGGSQYWSSTAIIIVWDDWGGWYDHVPPPQLDYAGLGFRVPMILVSPYAKQGYVSHTQYEFGSVIKFVEDVWNLGRLGTTDQRANSIDDMFNFDQAPRKFSQIDAKYPKSFFERQKPSNVPVDTN